MKCYLPLIGKFLFSKEMNKKWNGIDHKNQNKTQRTSRPKTAFQQPTDSASTHNATYCIPAECVAFSKFSEFLGVGWMMSANGQEIGR